MVSIGKGALNHADVISFGGDLALRIGADVYWDKSMKDSPGIGGTTPASLNERWIKESEQPSNPAIGTGYRAIQVLADGIEKAGSIDGDKVNEALGKTV
jgi:hypothetical protein